MKHPDTAHTSVQQTERTLGRGALYATAIGMVIGTGVITMTGTAIANTGHAVIFAYLLAALLMAVSIIPYSYLGGTIRLEGGELYPDGSDSPQIYYGHQCLYHAVSSGYYCIIWSLFCRLFVRIGSGY